MRPGFTTHAMNMGQRAMELNTTFTVNSDGSFVLHVPQPPPNANLLQPGPVFVFTTVKGIPSNGTLAIVGNGAVGTQDTSAPVPLPDSVRLDSASGSADPSSTGSSSSSTSSSGGTSHTGAVIGGIIGAIAVVGILGAILGICLQRRRRAAATAASRNAVGMGPTSLGARAAAAAGLGMQQRDSDVMPLHNNNGWNASTASLQRAPSPYKDMPSASGEFDPYAPQPGQGRRY